MGRIYQLKRTLITREHLDRLFKTFLLNVKEDRAEAKSLLDRCIHILDNLLSDVQLDQLNEFTKVMQAATKAFDSKMAANDKIKNVLTLLKDFLDKPLKNKDNPNTELDSHLTSLVKDIEKEITDDEND